MGIIIIYKINFFQNNIKIMTIIKYIVTYIIMKKHLFPYLKDNNKIQQLMIDRDAMHYITVRRYATQILQLILKHTYTTKKNIKDIIITDATACVGGDTLTMAKVCKSVNAIEISKLRCEYLQKNVNIYDLKNITIYNDDCDNIIHALPNHDIIYIDPPWEPSGISYKTHDKLTLPFCGVTLENYCNKLFDSSYMLQIPSMVVLKLPKNYDMEHFYNNIINVNTYCYNLDKMIIIILINNNIDV